MKKTVKLIAMTLAAVMMISFCSCTDKSSKKTSSSKDKEAVTETTEESSSSTANSELYKLMSDLIGKDQATAEKMIGEYFGVELKDLLGGIMTDERNGIVTVTCVYSELLVKDSVRFNELEIWVDEKDGHVRRVEFSLVNDAYNAYKIEDTPEFREEIKKQYSEMQDDFQKTYGEAFEKGHPIYDEDSYFFMYNVANGIFANVEIRDFTEEGGNGLMRMSIIYADALVLLDS